MSTETLTSLTLCLTPEQAHALAIHLIEQASKVEGVRPANPQAFAYSRPGTYLHVSGAQIDLRLRVGAVA